MRIVVTGASGQLGSYLLDGLVGGPDEVIAWSQATLTTRQGVPLRRVELTERDQVAKALEEADPDVVIHTAAVSSALAAHRDPLRCEAVNVEATRFLSDWVGERDRRLVYTSTDLVFDGSRAWSGEDDVARPLSVYGKTKHAAERFVLDTPRGLVARLSLLYGPSRSGREGYFDRTTTALRAGTAQGFFVDEFRTPLDYSTAAAILVRLARSPARGLYHVGGPERLSRFELMGRAATALGLDPLLVTPTCREDTPFPEPRPADVSLDSSRLRRLFSDLVYPGIEKALASGHE